ncbi:MAG: T9SS type A sorting domain-containing protein [Bacteroidetes bacterium]|nr:T9SS type A sorting domain-containing protein [Bacteroidota bacterium]
MALNSLPEAAIASPVNLGVRIHASGSYALQLKQFSGFDYGTDLFIEDIQKDIIVKLSEDTVYQFYSDEADGLRFRLTLFEPEQHSVETDETIHVFANQGSIQIISYGTAIQSAEIFDYSGRLIHKSSNLKSTNQTIALPNVNGFVIVKLRTKADVISKKVFIH